MKSSFANRDMALLFLLNTLVTSILADLLLFSYEIILCEQEYGMIIFAEYLSSFYMA